VWSLRRLGGGGARPVGTSSFFSFLGSRVLREGVVRAGGRRRWRKSQSEHEHKIGKAWARGGGVAEGEGWMKKGRETRMEGGQDD
jgi:hypothetical protein